MEVVMVVAGALGLTALVFWSRSHLKSQPMSTRSQPLIFMPIPALYEASQSVSAGTWEPGSSTHRRDPLTRDMCFLHHIAQVINNAPSLNNTLEYVLQELTKHLAVDMGRIFLLDDEETLQMAISVGVPNRQNSLPDWAFTLPNLALAIDKPLTTPDLRHWPQLRAFVSATELISTLWLPLKTGGRAVGALELGSLRPDAFDEGIVAVVMTVASYLATIAENFSLRRHIAKEKELRQALQRYVSPRLVTTFQEDPVPHPQEIIDASERMSVLFADVRNFTPLMEKADPDAVMLVLNEYFLRMSQIIQANGGVVDEFAGDEIVASFDCTSPRVNDAYRAVRAGLEMLDGLKALQKRWQRRGLPTFDIGIGISTGAVTRGSVGSHERRAIIALGSILNIASRAEGMNKKFDTCLIITQSTFEQVANLIEYDPLGAHVLEGISEPIPLYSVKGLKNGQLSETRAPYGTDRIAQVTQRRQALAEQINPGVSPDILP